MGAHLIKGEFQSDKYPSCPRGKVPLSTKDLSAQDLLWEYAERRRHIDEEFSKDLQQALVAKGYKPPSVPKLDAGARRWQWRTWNLLLQIQHASDGEDPRQRSGEMEGRGLCVAYKPAMRAIEERGWAEVVDHAEVRADDCDDENDRYWPVWVITTAGRQALRTAKSEGITIQ